MEAQQANFTTLDWSQSDCRVQIVSPHGGGQLEPLTTTWFNAHGMRRTVLREA